MRVEGEFLAVKIKQLSDMVDISIAENISEIDGFVGKMEAYLDEYFSLSVKLKCCYGRDYDDLYNAKFQKETLEMNSDIKMAKLLKKKLLEKEEKTKIETDKNNVQFKQVIEAQNLISEIEFRCDSLESKLHKKIEDLSDYQILEISQNKNMDLEFNGILEKVISCVCRARWRRGGAEVA